MSKYLIKEYESAVFDSYVFQDENPPVHHKILLKLKDVDRKYYVNGPTPNSPNIPLLVIDKLIKSNSPEINDLSQLKGACVSIIPRKMEGVISDEDYVAIPFSDDYAFDAESDEDAILVYEVR